MQVILQAEVHCPSLIDCVEFVDIPVLDPVHIAIYAEQGGGAQAVQLYNTLHQTILALNPKNTNSFACRGPRLLSCK